MVANDKSARRCRQRGGLRCCARSAHLKSCKLRIIINSWSLARRIRFRCHRAKYRKTRNLALPAVEISLLTAPNGRRSVAISGGNRNARPVVRFLTNFDLSVEQFLTNLQVTSQDTECTGAKLGCVKAAVSANCGNFDQLWPIITILKNCENFDQFWQFWPIVTILTNWDNFDYSIRVSYAGGNGRRSAAISGGNRNERPVIVTV